MSVATNVDKTAKQRVAAMAAAPLAVGESDKDMQAMLNVLRNTDEPIAVRLAALQSLGAASFQRCRHSSPCRGDYIATLRKVATDPDPELRQRVLGILMRDKDGFAQKKLLDGLKDPAKALVPPEKALQLLSYDVHADAYPGRARHRQEATERRREARGAAAARGRRQGGAAVREGAARQEGVAREPADRSLGIAFA